MIPRPYRIHLFQSIPTVYQHNAIHLKLVGYSMKKLNPDLLQSDVVIATELPEYDVAVANVIDPDWLVTG